MKQAIKRSWKQMAKEHIRDTTPTIPLGKNFWVLAKNERTAVKTLFGQKDTQKLVTMLRSRPDDAPVKVLDAAYWMKGCSSLGLMRIAVLLQVGKKAKNDLCLIDMKEAINPIAPADAKSSIPKNNAERVVQGAILFGFWTSRSHRPHCKLIPIRVARDLSAASTRDCHVNVLFSHVAKILFAKAPLCL
jgi:uncharacterized protein (DUF2252 family)